MGRAGGLDGLMGSLGSSEGKLLLLGRGDDANRQRKGQLLIKPIG